MKPDNEQDLRGEYKREDLGKGVRGKHYRAYQGGTNLALLAPEIREAFPTDEEVNEALRSVLAQRGLSSAAKS